MTGEAGQAASTRRLELVAEPADALTAALADGAQARDVDGDLRASRHSFERAYQLAERALARIAEADPILGDHLRQTVHTGVRCSYWPS
jgi:hypothetical protein